MDLVSILRTLGGLATVLGILSGALWLVRRYDIRLPGRTGMLRVSRLELVERLPLDARRSVALLRRDGREHLILIAPEGHLILESAVVRDAVDVAAVEAVADAIPREIPHFSTELAAAGQSFGALVEQARGRAVPVGRALGLALRRGLAAIATVFATVKRKRAPARAEALRLWAVIRNAALRPPSEHKRALAWGKATVRRLIDRATALAASAPPILYDPPPPQRASYQRKPNRKAARKAQAARRGLRHA